MITVIVADDFPAFGFRVGVQNVESGRANGPDTPGSFRAPFYFGGFRTLA